KDRRNSIEAFVETTRTAKNHAQSFRFCQATPRTRRLRSRLRRAPASAHDPTRNSRPALDRHPRRQSPGRPNRPRGCSEWRTVVSNVVERVRWENASQQKNSGSFLTDWRALGQSTIMPRWLGNFLKRCDMATRHVTAFRIDARFRSFSKTTKV